MFKRKPQATTGARDKTPVKTQAKTPMKTPTPRPDGHGALMVGGVQGNAGGGRPKEALRRLCREIYAGRTDEEQHGAEFLGKVMRGTETEDVLVTVGSGKDAVTRMEPMRPKIRDRLLAAELLADRGYGKPEQAVQIEDERPRRTGEEVVADIMEMLPRVIAVLPVDKKEIARLLEQRRRIEVLVSGQQVENGRNGNGE